MDDERRREAERQAAAKRALSPQVRADALRLVTEWNERQAQRAPLLFSPTIGSVSVNFAHSGTGTPFACSGLVNVQLGCGVHALSEGISRVRGQMSRLGQERQDRLRARHLSTDGQGMVGGRAYRQRLFTRANCLDQAAERRRPQRTA